jgi:hypothetical protein
MPLVINTGAFVVNQNPKPPNICLKAVFQVEINLIAIWRKCSG